MFQFDGLPPRTLWIRVRVPQHDLRRVPPFGHPGISGRLRLPRDYRGLPRPSSASCAKASAARPYYLRFPLGFQVTILKNQMVMDSHIALHRDRRCEHGAPPLGGGPGFVSIDWLREPRENDFTRVSISMKRYAAVKVPGRAPWGPDAGRAGPVGPVLLELSQTVVSLERR